MGGTANGLVVEWNYVSGTLLPARTKVSSDAVLDLGVLSDGTLAVCTVSGTVVMLDTLTGTDAGGFPAVRSIMTENGNDVKSFYILNNKVVVGGSASVETLGASARSVPYCCKLNPLCHYVRSQVGVEVWTPIPEPKSSDQDPRQLRDFEGRRCSVCRPGWIRKGGGLCREAVDVLGNYCSNTAYCGLGACLGNKCGRPYAG